MSHFSKSEFNVRGIARVMCFGGFVTYILFFSIFIWMTRLLLDEGSGWFFPWFVVTVFGIISYLLLRLYAAIRDGKHVRRQRLVWASSICVNLIITLPFVAAIIQSLFLPPEAWRIIGPDYLSWTLTMHILFALWPVTATILSSFALVLAWKERPASVPSLSPQSSNPPPTS